MDHTKEFDPTLAPSILPFDGDEDDDDNDVLRVSSPPHEISSSGIPPPTRGFIFTAD